MSKVSISGNASGTGVFTIQAPNSNVDRVLSLPDEAGTVLTTAGVPASAMPAGSVLQVVTYQYNYGDGDISTSSDGDVPTGISLSITPTATNSKIICTLTGGCQDWGTVNVQGVTSIRRSINGGALSNLGYIDAFYGASGAAWDPHSGCWVDTTHNTTLPITYYLYMRSRSAVGLYYFHNETGGVTGSMVFQLMEVKV